LPIVAPDALEFCVAGGVLGGLAVVVWWAFFSRAPRFERWGAVALMIVALGAASRILHPSIATGMMGMVFPIYAIPVLSLAFVVWAVATQRLSDGLRRVTMVATILLACGVWTLLRTDGITGDAASDFAWRWAETAEERLLAHANGRRPGVCGGDGLEAQYRRGAVVCPRSAAPRPAGPSGVFPHHCRPNASARYRRPGAGRPAHTGDWQGGGHSASPVEIGGFDRSAANRRRNPAEDL
jgi:hypothetical protein